MSTKIQFRKAERKQKKARILISGVSGGGKTMTALKLAMGLRKAGRVAFIDTERGSSELYAGEGKNEFDFDVIQLTDYKPETFLEAADAAADTGAYDVLIIDSLTHSWEGPGGFLDIHRAVTDRSAKKDSYAAWNTVTPMFNQFIDHLLRLPMHVICCLRVKTDYDRSENEKGRLKIEKVGLAPKFRPENEYEWDISGRIDIEHKLMIDKTRLSFLKDAVIKEPDEKLGLKIRDWLDAGKAVTVYQYDPISLGASLETKEQKQAANETFRAHNVRKVGKYYEADQPIIDWSAFLITNNNGGKKEDEQQAGQNI